MSGSLTFFFNLTLVGTPPFFFTVCLKNVGPRLALARVLQEQERAYFALQFNNGESEENATTNNRQLSTNEEEYAINTSNNSKSSTRAVSPAARGVAARLTRFEASDEEDEK